MSAYYNEFDPDTAAWLRELIMAGVIADGVVDTRSIEDVRPADLEGFTQCHFFAGIGVWSYALRAAGWPDDRPVWTGSCPCQPFSAAGKGLAFADERHLWPAFHHLIAAHVEWCRRQKRPIPTLLGEQVASKDVDAWIDLVHADLEALGYAFGSVPFPSAGVGAPHIRDRNYWVGHAGRQGLDQRERIGRISSVKAGVCAREAAIGAGIHIGGLADTELQPGCAEHECGPRGRAEGPDDVAELGRHGEKCGPGPTNGFWRDADWLGCRDGKWRPVSPKPQPLVDGSAASLGRVCAEAVTEIEGEINAWAMESKIDGNQALRDLQECLIEESHSCWEAGRIPLLREAPFLLAFLRQLAGQGWRFSECSSLPGAEASQAELRMLRDDGSAPSAPREHGLEGQQPGERTDAVHFLSSLLARHAHTAWDNAYAAYAEIGFPLAIGARSRVVRLRGYGNAINAEAARVWIETVMACLP